MKKSIIAAAAICLVATSATGCLGGEKEARETAEVKRGDLTISVSVSGNLEIPEQRDLTFAMAGTVEDVLVEKGDTVSAGDVLATLEDEDLIRNIDLARTGLRQARTQYEMAEIQLKETIYPHYYRSYLVDVPGTWMALNSAKENLDEARRHIQSGDSSEAQASLNIVEEYISKAKVRAQSRPWEFPLSIKLKELELEQAQAALDNAELELEQARDALEDTTITAPYDGLITEVTVDEGDTVAAGMSAGPLFHIVDPSTIEMSGLIDEIDIAGVELGQKASITLDALPDREYSGTVTYISKVGTIEAGVVSYETTITLDQPGPELKDGMSATAEIVVQSREDVLLLPNRAIQGSWDNPKVELLVDRETTEREITLGLSDGMYSEVKEGLEAGDTVVMPESQLPFRMFGE
jgi:multidrug efflux pump subunit AcrA (membrane-fusion protein)